MIVWAVLLLVASVVALAVTHRRDALGEAVAALRERGR